MNVFKAPELYILKWLRLEILIYFITIEMHFKIAGICDHKCTEYENFLFFCILSFNVSKVISYGIICEITENEKFK